MRVPMKSLQPALRQSWASLGPSFTQEAWMFLIQLLRMIRETAYILTTSGPVAPGRTSGTRPLLYMGASSAMKERGTNSVKPPVWRWMSRRRTMWAALWRGGSGGPCMVGGGGGGRGGGGGGRSAVRRG